MERAYYNEISNDLIKLIINLNKKTFNHDKIFKCMPVPPSHVKVIFYLSHNGPNSVSFIGKELEISKPNMTPIIDKLVQDKLVVRYEDPKDRRKILVDITKKGSKFLKIAKQEFLKDISLKLSKLDMEDLHNLSCSMKTLHTIMEKL